MITFESRTDKDSGMVYYKMTDGCYTLEEHLDGWTVAVMQRAYNIINVKWKEETSDETLQKVFNETRSGG